MTTKHRRRHPRTRHDAEILCALDCGLPVPDCRCLTAMLHDRALTATTPADTAHAALTTTTLRARVAALEAMNAGGRAHTVAGKQRAEEVMAIRTELDARGLAHHATAAAAEAPPPAPEPPRGPLARFWRWFTAPASSACPMCGGAREPDHGPGGRCPRCDP